MPKIKPKLTEMQIKNAKPKAAPYKLYDEGGLCLLIRPTGTKVWQLALDTFSRHIAEMINPILKTRSRGSKIYGWKSSMRP